MLGGLGMGELLIVLVIVIVVFGATKLPQIGAGLGRGINNFRKEVKTDKNEEIEDSKKEKKSEESDIPA